MKATKEEMAGVVLSKLIPGRDDVLVDVGCGSGSFASFISRYVGRVLTVEIDPEALARCHEVVGGLGNVELIPGDALEVLRREEYDLVFLGGTRGMDAMLPVALRKARRVVVNAARLEVAQRAIDIMREADAFGEALVIEVARSYDLAGGTAFRALNPVFMVISCCTE